MVTAVVDSQRECLRKCGPVRRWLPVLVAGLLVLADEALPQQADSDTGDVQLEIGADEPIKLRRVARGNAAIDIDGRLDEAAWQMPRINDPLRIISPDTLETPAYRTDVRLFYTERGLYVGIDMQQPAATLVERDTARDNVDENRDNVSFSLDTSGSGLYGYWMNLALGDNLADGTLLPERRYNREWDGAWYGATQRTAGGWSAEAFIPWSQVSMPGENATRHMGFYVSRKVAHRNETWAWPALPESQSRFMSILPKLAIADVDPRQQWSLFPFVSSTYDAIDTEVRHKAGLDVFWRPSSNFQLTATANPDFGSVEADDVIVNLTADETFFPEKRLFFLEGQEIFNTTPRSVSGSQRFTVVNTRRIGGRARPPELPQGVRLPLRQALRPTDLVGAGKATGQAGAFRYGVLAAFEDDSAFNVGGEEYLQDGRNFAALRLLYEDDRGAAYRGLGLISTLVSHPESDAVVHAADFHLLSRSGRWNIDGQMLTSDRDETGTGYGAYADISFNPRQGLTHTLELTAFDDTLDVNDLGFQRRNDVREAWYRLEWVKSGLRRIRNFTISPFLRYEVNGDGYRTNNAIASNFLFKLNSLDEVEVFAAHFPQRFDDRNSFGNGTFDVAARQNLSVQYRSNTAQPLSAFGKIGYQGEFVGGETYEVSAGFTWQPRSNVRMEWSTSWFDRNGWLLHQEDRNFTAFDARQWQPSMRVDYFLSSRQHFSAALQWVGIRAQEREFYTLSDQGTALTAGPKPPGPTDDFGLSQLSFQLRYRWQIAPLSDLFIVYTRGDTRRRSPDDFEDLFRDSWRDPLDDQLVVKLRYRLGS